MKVPHHDQEGVGRVVISPVIALQVLEGESLEVFHPADDRPVIRLLEESRGLQLLHQDG